MADPPESHVVLTDEIKRWIRTLLLTEKLPHDTREELIKYTKNRRNVEDKKARTIPFRLVQAVHKHLESEQGSGVYLHELLEGSELQLPSVELPARSPELEARIERLKAQQANRDYAQMTKNVDTKKTPIENLSIGQEIKGLNRHVISMINFALTVGGSFAFAYKAVEYSLATPSFEMQLCAGLIVGTIVFFADIYFLIKYDAEEG